MVPDKTKTLLLLSSIALLTTPASALPNAGQHDISSGRVEFTDTSVKRRHQAAPRQVKARSTKPRYAKARSAKARDAESYQAKRHAVYQHRRSSAVRPHPGHDAYAALPDLHAVVPNYYPPMHQMPMHYTPTQFATSAAPRRSKARKMARVHHSGSVGAAAAETGLVMAARRYIGTNPTGWARVWCGRFMAMIAPDAASRIGNPNLARNWARLPRTQLQVGAIAVLTRNGGGHVGVVSGIDANGNPIIISGNHNRRVAEAVYPRSRVVAYVRP